MPHDDFQIEPVPGLPELPPEDERILWQGKPDWWALAKESLWLKWVFGYFVFLGAWRSLALSDLVPLPQAIWGSVPFLILGGVTCSLLLLVAVIQAWATVYTITNKRVAMRIGAALTVTLNLPFKWIGAADLDLRKGGTGTIALRLLEDGSKLSYINLWPHVRPWKMKSTQPALRCIKDAEHVARILGQAASTRVDIAEGRVDTPAAVAAE